MFGRRLLLICVCAFGLLAVPATPVFAQASGPLIGEPAPQVSTDPPGDEDSSRDGLGKTAQLVIFVGALAAIAGIAWFIVRDARGVAGDERSRGPETPQRPEGERRPRGDRAKRRAKDKRAKQQRKRNRGK